MQTFIIDGEPVAKGRPRFTRRGHTYTPKKTADYEKHIKRELIEQGAKPFEKEVPLKVEVTFYKGHLKSWTKKQVFQAEDGSLLPVKRPDLDNYVKAILDGANEILWHDDSQIVDLLLYKRYDKTPRVEIKVNEIKFI